MSLLIVSDVDTQAERLRTQDPAVMAEVLSKHGVRFAQWGTRALANDATAADVLLAYAPEVERLRDEGRYASVDVVRMHPPADDTAWPDKARAARAKFLDEHTHGEDEVRFFVEGAGLFYLRFDAEVMLVLCERGDLLSVPAGTRHWFDMGEVPSFCAIRFFGTPEGWVASFTGDPIAKRFPSFDVVACDRGASR